MNNDDLTKFGANYVAKLKWPNDSLEHEALRKAYIEGVKNSIDNTSFIFKEYRKEIEQLTKSFGIIISKQSELIVKLRNKLKQEEC